MRKLYPFLFLLALIPSVYGLLFLEFPATEWNITIGAGGGNINATWEVNGSYIWINETVGTPAFQLNFNVTADNIPAIRIPLYIAIRNHYEGNPAHIVQLQALNQTSKNWVVIGTIPERNEYGWDNFSLVTEFNTLFHTPPSEWRIVHTSPGNINHWLRIDYISVIVVADTPCPTVIEPETYWIIGLIWVSLFIISNMIDSKIMYIFTGLVGLILGLVLLSVSSMTSVAVICLNLYLIYKGAENE